MDNVGLINTTGEIVMLETTLVPISRAFATLQSDLSPAPSVAAVTQALNGFEA
jgi:hypothetical protein